MYHSYCYLIALILILIAGWARPLVPAPTLADNNPNHNQANHTKDGAALAGRLIATGVATVNGQPAITGTTVFSQSRISVACGAGNSVAINLSRLSRLSRLGRIELGHGAEMTLGFSASAIRGELLSGEAVIKSAAGVKVEVKTPDGVSAADGQTASALPVAAPRGSRCAGGKTAASNSLPTLGTEALTGLLIGAEGAVVAAPRLPHRDRSASMPLP